jgi:hypothetical protein
VDKSTQKIIIYTLNTSIVLFVLLSPFIVIFTGFYVIFNVFKVGFVDSNGTTGTQDLAALGSGIAAATAPIGICLWLKKIVTRAVPDHELMVCINCGYSTEGLQSPICPECGNPIEPPTK